MNEALTPDELQLLDRIALETIEPVAPPTEMRARILDAVRHTRQFDTTIPGEHESKTIRVDEGTWTTVAEGARMKRLSKDKSRGTLTFLLDLDPHAIVDAHDHEGAEDSYVIRGSCHIGGMALNQGDFHHAEASVHHGDVVASGEGCLLLITVGVKAA
ncbi:MAG TPA: cupin domain-containing protein [Thermoanaerobaculia bacterium]|nr:cupin domain-containing protein [Thermoanaerobaculia bacterium]